MGNSSPLSPDGMTATTQEGKARPLTNPEKNNAQQVAKPLENLGPYSPVQKFIATYAKMTAKKAYSAFKCWHSEAEPTETRTDRG
jgi:hypothetical protein